MASATYSDLKDDQYHTCIYLTITSYVSIYEALIEIVFSRMSACMYTCVYTPPRLLVTAYVNYKAINKQVL